MTGASGFVEAARGFGYAYERAGESASRAAHRLAAARDVIEQWHWLVQMGILPGYYDQRSTR